MPGRRIEMRKLKEVLRLRLTAGLSNRKIAKGCGIARSTVAEYLARLDAARQETATGEVPVILWNQRWEYDKAPEIFLRALDVLAEEELAGCAIRGKAG